MWFKKETAVEADLGAQGKRVVEVSTIYGEYGETCLFWKLHPQAGSHTSLFVGEGLPHAEQVRRVHDGFYNRAILMHEQSERELYL